MENDRIGTVAAIDRHVPVPGHHLNLVVAIATAQLDVREASQRHALPIASGQNAVAQRPVGIGVGHVGRIRSTAEDEAAADRRLRVEHHVAYGSLAAVASQKAGPSENGDRSRGPRVALAVADQSDRHDLRLGQAHDLVGRADSVLVQILPDPGLAPLRIRRVEKIVSIAIVGYAQGIQIRRGRRHLGHEDQLVAIAGQIIPIEIDEQPAVVGCQPGGRLGPGAVQVELGARFRLRDKFQAVVIQIQGDRRCAGDPTGYVLIQTICGHYQVGRPIRERDISAAVKLCNP